MNKYSKLFQQKSTMEDSPVRKSSKGAGGGASTRQPRTARGGQTSIYSLAEL